MTNRARAVAGLSEQPAMAPGTNFREAESAEDPADEDLFRAVLADTVAALDGEDVPYVFMGGIGAATHGRPRWTHDIDVFVRPEDAGRALAALADAGYRTEQTHPDWLYKAFKHDVMVDVIFKSLGGILLDKEMLVRARVTEFQGHELRIMAPEDLLVIKAIVHDEHMPRHWHDALAIVSRCSLDWDYLVRRARRHGARRVLSLLLYAQSNDLVVPSGPVRALFDAVFTEWPEPEIVGDAAEREVELAGWGPDPRGEAVEHAAYLGERVREALAHDPRVAELGIAVEVAGDRVLLTGEVATPERREAVGEVVRPLIQGRTLENALTVTALTISDSEEQLA